MQTDIILETQKVGVQTIIEFNYDSEVKEIKRIELSCGCGVAINHPKEKKIVVKYTPNKIPPQRVDLGWYGAAKYLTVRYTSDLVPAEELVQILRFNVKVVK